MRHFLVTRWNLEALSVHSEPGINLDPEWLFRRRLLFQDFCLPSVRLQSVTDFAWIILLDARTPDAEWRWLGEQDDRIRTYAVENPQSAGTSELAEAIVGDGWLITTRLDSDDCLHHDYMRAVRLAAEETHCFIEFPDGLVYDADGDDLRWVREYSNPFLSRVEYGTRPLTVYDVEHNRARDAGPMVTLDGLGWMQIIHHGNVTNTLRGARVQDNLKAELLNEFGVAWEE